MEEPHTKARKMHHFTLEVAQQELAAAQQRVSELESVIRRLQKEEERKKQKFNYELILEGQPLHLALGWLSPQDHFSCVRVCREWRDQVDQPFVWEQAAWNQSPALLQKIQRLNKNRSQRWNFKAIAKGVVHKQSTETSRDHGWSPKPVLQPHEVFLLIEAKDQESGEIIGSWCVSFDQWKAPDVSHYSFMNILDVDKKGILPAASEGGPSDPFCDDDGRLVSVQENISRSLVFSARLLRCDTGQSVGLLFEKKFNCLEQEWGFVDLDTIRPDATTDNGVRALALWSLQGYDSMALWIRCNIAPSDPPSSQTDPTRCEKARYCLNSVDCNFMVYAKGSSDETFASLRQVLVSMEGLDWQ
jgi:hypothetical protein